LKSSKATNPAGWRLPVEWFKRVAGYLFALGGLAWVLYDVHPRQLVAHLTIQDWRWAGVAIAADIFAFTSQGWRWSLLLAPLGKISTIRATQAIYVGLFTSEVVPLRAGELVRAYLISRRLSAPFPSVIASIAVERLLDGISLALCLGAAAVFVPLPRSIATTGDIFGIGVIVCAVGLAYFVYRYGRQPAHQREPAGRIRLFLRTMLAGSHSIITSGNLWFAFGISFLVLGLQSLAFWLMMPACGLNVPFWIGAVVFFIVHLGTAIPNAPANVGSYQFFTVLGLTLFGVDKATAAGFSIVVFLVLSIPLWIIGFLALTASGMSLWRVRQEIPRLKARTESQ
jgi:uncharacterized protein (TIRG00374 family)